MDFEKALEFAVISSWEELIKPGGKSSIHVEYANVAGIPVASLPAHRAYTLRSENPAVTTAISR